MNIVIPVYKFFSLDIQRKVILQQFHSNTCFENLKIFFVASDYGACNCKVNMILCQKNNIR